MTPIKALVITGYGLNCDYETDYSLRLAGAESHRVHLNRLIGSGRRSEVDLADFHILVLGGGFSWADEHGAGVVMATKLRKHLGEAIDRFIGEGKLVLGICNGFQALANLGLIPGFHSQDRKRCLAVTYNDCGNFIDTWVHLGINTESPCVFTREIRKIELPVRHGEGKVFAADEDLERLFRDGQVVMQYADVEGRPAQGAWPMNPNGSLRDIAGICDPTGRVFGLMPHPEAYNRCSNHPDWTRRKALGLHPCRRGWPEEGEGVKIFRNAVDYMRENL